MKTPGQGRSRPSTPRLARRTGRDERSRSRLAESVSGHVAVVTGASSGIGRATAIRLAEAGAHVALVARSTDALEDVRCDIVGRGGVASVHSFDLSLAENCTAAVAHITAEHGSIDILVNNAGRSIRRSIRESLDRFHDVERTAQLNYFGPAALILAVLGAMLDRKSGHIVNVSSIGTQWPAPRFAAYVGSKAALEAFCRSIATEVVNDGIALSTVYMPLVRTPMIEASAADIDRIPAWGPDQAAAMICEALVTRRPRVTTGIGYLGQVMLTASPSTSQRLMSRTNRRAHVFSTAGGRTASKGYAGLLREIVTPKGFTRSRSKVGQ